jgi:hypothetical protein
VPILIAEKRSAEFPDTPTIMEFVKDESTQQQLDLLMVSQGLDWPVMLPPGVPAGRVEELRQAFDAAMADAAFRPDVENRNLHVDPVGGEAGHGGRARPGVRVAGGRHCGRTRDDGRPIGAVWPCRRSSAPQLLS